MSLTDSLQVTSISTIHPPLDEHLIVDDGSAIYQRGALNTAEADQLLSDLIFTVPWRHDSIKLFGRSILQPRLTAWMGDPGATYRYAGLSLEPLPWNSSVEFIRTRIQRLTGLTFNSALLNLYRDGNDSMGWHRDNEKELGREPVIVSVSLGAERLFALRRYHSKKDKKTIKLEHGSMLIMSGQLQQYWEHCIPKVQKALAKATGPRINLTFRRVNVTS